MDNSKQSKRLFIGFVIPASAKTIQSINDSADSLFIYALIWSVGATTNSIGRKKFDSFIKLTSEQEKGTGTTYAFSAVFSNPSHNNYVCYLSRCKSVKIYSILCLINL